MAKTPGTDTYARQLARADNPLTCIKSLLAKGGALDVESIFRKAIRLNSQWGSLNTTSFGANAKLHVALAYCRLAASPTTQNIRKYAYWKMTSAICASDSQSDLLKIVSGFDYFLPDNQEELRAHIAGVSAAVTAAEKSELLTPRSFDMLITELSYLQTLLTAEKKQKSKTIARKLGGLAVERVYAQGGELPAVGSLLNREMGLYVGEGEKDFGPLYSYWRAMAKAALEYYPRMNEVIEASFESEELQHRLNHEPNMTAKRRKTLSGRVGLLKATADKMPKTYIAILPTPVQGHTEADDLEGLKASLEAASRGLTTT